VFQSGAPHQKPGPDPAKQKNMELKPGEQWKKWVKTHPDPGQCLKSTDVKYRLTYLNYIANFNKNQSILTIKKEEVSMETSTIIILVIAALSISVMFNIYLFFRNKQLKSKIKILEEDVSDGNELANLILNSD